MSGDVDLLGDPLPASLPEGVQLIDAEDLAGHTIHVAFQDPGGRLDCDLVLVTTTRCWIVFKAEAEGCGGEDGAYLNTGGGSHYGKPVTLHDYVSAKELLLAGVIYQAEFEALKSIEVQREAEMKARQAASLRARLAQLEGGAT